MIPVYGFLRGDTIGLLILAEKSESIGELANRLLRAASVRVAPLRAVEVWYKGQRLDSGKTIEESGILPLERFDVIEEGGIGVPESS